jgi:glycosyltransferase involved in cell wall biosynthesis
MVVNFVSDLATPHVNDLLRAVVDRGVTLRAWYAAEKHPEYAWDRTYSHDVVAAHVFGLRWPSAELLLRAVRRGERFVVVGWSNPTTRLLLPVLAGLRRGFVFYTDHPQPRSETAVASLLRARYMRLLRSGIVLAVGRNAVDYFLQRGFDPGRVFNLPIPVSPRADLDELRARRAAIRASLGVRDGMTLFAAGSRLLRTKGFDLALAAMASLDADVRARFRFLLVGDGPELGALKEQAATAGLADVVRFEPWMQPADFDAHLGAADVVLHPARFDAYGAASLSAVALGVPVVGSRSAGSAVELIRHGENGFLYDPEDVPALAAHLRHFIEHAGAAREMGARQAEVAARYSPERMADVFLASIREVA